MIPRPSRPARVVLAAGIAVVLSSAGCASGGGSADAGRGFVFATDMEPDCLDPQYSALDVTATVDRPIFDSLVAMSSDGRFHPWLAERWTAGRDGRSYTFTLRRGVRFHDGTPLDAAAVKATLDHAVDPKTKSRYAASLIRGYRGSDVVSPTTVRVRLDEPNAAFLQALSTPYLGIQSPASIEKNARGLCGAPVGSGPFRFVGWTRSKSITLARNPGYSWGPATAANRGAARIPRLTFRIISENSVRLGALTSGEVHAIDNVPALNMKTLERSSSATVKRAQVPGAVFGVFLNGTKGVLADERVRVALQRSLDMDAIVKSVYMGRASRAWSLLSPATVGYEPKTVGSWPYDPALSARLLDQAGWTGRDAEGFRTKDGRRLTLRWPYQAQLFRDRRDVLAQAIQAQAKRVGIHVDLRSVDAGTLTQQVLAARDRMDVMGASFVRPEPDILRYFYAADRFPGKGGGNFFRYTDGKLDGWLTDAAESTDPDERRQIYSRIQLHLNAHALVIPTYVPERVLGVSKKVAGLGFDASATPLFHEASFKP